MKKTILIIIALILVGIFAASAQNSIIMQKRAQQQNSKDFESQKLPIFKKTKLKQDWWEPDTIYSYNDQTESRIIFNYKYNLQELTVVSIEQFIGNYNVHDKEYDSWKNRESFIYIYDSNNNLLSILRQKWINDSWENDESYIYTYDSNNNLLTEQYERSYSNHLYTYTYDSNNNLTSILYQIKKNDLWINSYFETCTYDSNNNLLTSLRQNWDNDLWINSYFETRTYDSNNNLITELQQIYSNDLWKNYRLYTYTHDSNNNLLTLLLQNWENDLWINYAFETRSYDSNNNLLTRLQQEWSNDSWKDSFLYTHIYDSNNNLLTESRYFPNGGEVYREYRRMYDENNNCISAEIWDWNWTDETWHPSNVGSAVSYVNLYFYYNNMQSNYGLRSSSKMTASYIKVSDIISGKEEIKTASPIQIRSEGKTIHINNQTGKNAVITVYRIDGVKVTEQTTKSQITALEMPLKGLYLVSVKAENEKPVTEKVIVR